MDHSVRTLLGASILGAALFMAGCGEKKGGDAADTPAGGRADSTPAARTQESTAAAPAAEVKTFTFHGTPTAIDAATGVVSLKHEKIPGFTEQESGSYPVADPAILGQLKVGTETHFTLRVAGDRALITSVQQGHEAGHEH